MLISVFKRFKKSFIMTLLVLTVFTLPLLRGFFQPGMLQTYDSVYRLTRSAKFYIALRQSQLMPRWIGDVNHGVGSPIFTYLYPFPYYITALFHSMKLTLIDALKFSWVLFYILSGFAMFIFLRSIFPWAQSFLGAIFYLWNPYRLVQLYIRGAYEETAAYVFIPVVFLAILKISTGNRHAWLWGAVALGVFLLTQSSISIMFLPGFFALIFFLGLRTNWQYLKYCIFMLTGGFSLAAMTIFPNLFERSLIQIQHRLVREELYLNNLVSPIRLLYSSWESHPYPPAMLGFAQVAVVGLSILLLYQILNNKLHSSLSCWHFYLFVMALFWTLVAIVLMVNIPLTRVIWRSIDWLHFIYVPYLLQQLIVFWVSILTAFVTEIWKSKRLFIVLLLSVIGGNALFIRPDYKFMIQDADLYNFDGSLSQFYEFYPQTATKGDRAFKKYPLIRTEKSSTQIKLLKKTYDSITIDVNAVNEDRLTLQQLYFPGWRGYRDGLPLFISHTGETVDLRLDRPPETDAGLMMVELPAGVYQLVFRYGGTSWRRAGELLTVCTAFIFGLFSVMLVKKRRTPRFI